MRMRLEGVNRVRVAVARGNYLASLIDEHTGGVKVSRTWEKVQKGEERGERSRSYRLRV
jgi:hypothetical protein